MSAFEMFDRWWFGWVGLFADLPFWNPYVASLVALIAIRLAIELFHIIDRLVWRTPKREIAPPE